MNTAGSYRHVNWLAKMKEVIVCFSIWKVVRPMKTLWVYGWRYLRTQTYRNCWKIIKTCTNWAPIRSLLLWMYILQMGALLKVSWILQEVNRAVKWLAIFDLRMMTLLFLTPIVYLLCHGLSSCILTLSAVWHFQDILI